MNIKKAALALLLPILLLTSCKSEDTQHYYINTTSYCQIENTIYRNYGAKLRRYSTAFPEGNILCLDPLCRHYDSICPEHLFSYDLVTDGEMLYIHSYSYYQNRVGTVLRNDLREDNNFRRLDAIYRLDPSTGEMKVLAEYSAANGLVTCITTDGEYIYYVETYLKDNAVDRENDTYDIPKRVPCKGGNPEEFLEGDYSAYAVVYADRENYYVTDNNIFIQINRETGEKISVPQPGSYSHYVIFHNGEVYLDSSCLCKWENGSFTEVLGNIGSYLAWDKEGVWYTKKLPEEERVYLGSKEAFDGRGMSMYDFYRTSDGMLRHFNLATGEETAYSLGDINMGVNPEGVVNGYIIASCRDESKLDFNYEMKILKPEPDGTVTFYDAVKPEE